MIPNLKPGRDILVVERRTFGDRTTIVAPYVVTKIGREYFYARPAGKPQCKHLEKRFALDDGRESRTDGFTGHANAFADQKAYDDHLRAKRIAEAIGEKLPDRERNESCDPQATPKPRRHTATRPKRSCVP